MKIAGRNIDAGAALGTGLGLGISAMGFDVAMQLNTVAPKASAIFRLAAFGCCAITIGEGTNIAIKCFKRILPPSPSNG